MSPSLTGALLLCLVAAEPFDEVLLLSSLPQATSAPLSAIATATVKLRVLTFPPEIQTSVNAARYVRTRTRRSRGARRPSGCTSHDQRHHVAMGVVGGNELADLAAATQDDRPVGHLDDVVHRVRDDDDALPLVAQADDEVEHLARLAHAERGGRLVEDDQTRREGRRTSHSDGLAL